MSDRDNRIEISINKVWGDAWAVYKLLFRRSVTTAAIVYAAVEALDPLSDALDRRWASILFAIASFLLGISAPVIIQGALVEIVRNIHEARRPATIGRLYEKALSRVHSLLWASIVYGFGVVFGLLLLVVPGLLAASRWCLMAPLIVLEDESAGEARNRSSILVRPATWTVLGIIIAAFIATSLVGEVPVIALNHLTDAPALIVWAVTVVGSSLTAPFSAHVLTVIYYRLTDPENPVIHPDVRTWRSVWETT